MSTALQLPPNLHKMHSHSRRWTKQEFYLLGDLGFFKGQRAELIEGEIMVLSPQKFPHATATNATAETLRAAFGPEYWVRMQLPLDLTPLSEPEPDISVATGHRQDFTAHPQAAVLIVEVSDTTLAYDQSEKASLYAHAGILDYWIVNIPQGQVEVYRDPVADASQLHGFRYANVTVHSLGTSVSPLALPTVSLPVVSLFR